MTHFGYQINSSLETLNNSESGNFVCLKFLKVLNYSAICHSQLDGVIRDVGGHLQLPRVPAVHDALPAEAAPGAHRGEGAVAGGGRGHQA